MSEMLDTQKKTVAIIREMQRAGLVHVSFAAEGPCKRCGFVEDLRMGACFFCSNHVCGKDHGNGLHELWDAHYPENRWVVSVPRTGGGCSSVASMHGEEA